MPTLREVLLYNVALVSDQIHRIKIEAHAQKKAKRWGYVHTDGTFYGQNVPKDVNVNDVSYVEIEYDKVTSHINPKHKDWRKYLGLKAEATQLFASLWNLNPKRMAGLPPTTIMNRIQAQLVEGKRNFNHVNQWVKQRELLKAGVIKEEVHA